MDALFVFSLFNLGRSSLALAVLIAVVGVVVALSAFVSSGQLALSQLPHLSKQGLTSERPSSIDVGFAQSMLLHHNQAVHMAMMLRDSADPNIRGLADSIALTQLHEAGLMQGWLSAWGEPPVVAGPPMAWVEQATNLWHLDDQLYAAQCKAAGGKMAGLATAEELKELGQRTGNDQKRMFLQLMIAHHQAALPMANFAFRNGSSPMVKGFSRNMAKEQTGEIELMKQLLAQLNLSETGQITQ
jgi:uncharacterized protein (DUF305 family)